MEFTADQVWGCAAAAHRINEGYLKEDVWMHNATPPYLFKTANKQLVKKWLREQNFVEVTQDDITAGQSYRNHFKTYTLLAITGQLNDFQLMALRIATKETFTGRDMLDFAIVACLPGVAERDQDRSALKKDIYASNQLSGNEGDSVRGMLRVISSNYSKAYNKNRVTAVIEDSFVDFWAQFSVVAGEEFMISAKIKQQRPNKTTQLHFVKKLK
jgi:hypothetical protein